MLMQRLFRFILIALFATLCPAVLGAGMVDQILVVLDGEPYTLSNLKDYASGQIGRQFPAGDLNRLEKDDQEVLEQFITDKLLAAEIKQGGIKVGEDEIDQYIAQIKEKNQLRDADLLEALKREGTTIEKYRASIRAEIEKAEIINRQVRKRVNITSEDVERYYTLNQKRYLSEQRVRLRHILLSLPDKTAAQQVKAAMTKAAEIRKRATSGEDFAALAQEFTEGAGGGEGGDIGWVTRGTLLKEIEDLAFYKLSIGEVSQPVRTSLGVHLIKLENREGGRQLPLAEVQAKVREELYEKALEERFQQWLKGDLRRKHRVDVKLPGVVFRAQDKKDSTMSSLAASTSKGARSERSGLLSYLNPFSYIFKETPIEEEEEGKPSRETDQSVISFLGTPLFKTDSADDVPEDPVGALEPKTSDKSQDSGGFFSSVWQSINPFSKGK
jgi:peptidyl-prolyl cis-trans isomerase SurA